MHEAIAPNQISALGPDPRVSPVDVLLLLGGSEHRRDRTITIATPAPITRLTASRTAASSGRVPDAELDGQAGDVGDGGLDLATDRRLGGFDLGERGAARRSAMRCVDLGEPCGPLLLQPATGGVDAPPLRP